MKHILLFISLFSFAFIVNGQNISRNITFRSIDKDSVNLSLNENYNLIEDSCAQIIRHSRYHFETRKFYGKFTDVSKGHPNIIVSEGTYSPGGLKEGDFILRYLNGNLQAKGNFKNDKPDGHWQIFYEDGKPELIFDAKNEIYTIAASWKADGSKIIDNGNGAYTVDLSFFYWKGKLVNGRPDGAWKMYKKNDEDKTVIATEHFKKGEFIDGSNAMTSYTNASRINLFNPAGFKFLNAEMLLTGSPCNTSLTTHVIVNAHYKAGLNAFNYDIRDALSNYFNHHDPEGIDTDFFISGDVSLDGHIVNLTRGGSYVENIAQGIMSVIASLPRLNPATIDGKPVGQKFKISLMITKGSYSYSFQFLPIRI